MSGAQHSRSAGTGLERSCGEGGNEGGDWFRHSAPAEGIERLRAWFGGTAYGRHRHDTYAIGVTDTGVQAFDYRGAGRASLPGQVLVLHPDEAHDGHAGSAEGFGYRMLYVRPELIGEAARALCGGPVPLPFVAEPVSRNPDLAQALDAAFAHEPEPLAADSLVLRLAKGLLAGDRTAARRRSAAADEPALDRARAFLDAESARVVRSAELEAASGLSRYELARQFRARYGTSPYRYALLRRLDRARQLIAEGGPLADVALAAGFADQAHLTRRFRAAYGLPPARYAALSR